MQCRAKPYEGNEPYIFFSYCHKNADIVYPIIEKMAQDGFRIWYDNGIHPGDDWSQEIAVRLNNSFLCIAAITKDADESHNCRNEINVTINHNKKLLPIILEEFGMSLGLELLIASFQYIKKFELSNEIAFYEKLYTTGELNRCRGSVSLLPKVEESDNREIVPINEIGIAEKYIIKTNSHVSDKQDQDIAVVPCSKQLSDYEDNEKTQLEYSEEGTIVKTDLRKNAPMSRASGITDKLNKDAIFCCFFLKKLFVLNKKTTKIGRSPNKSDIVINDPEISALHAVIFYESNQFYIRDSDSTNGTELNQVTQLEGLQPVMLDTYNVISLAGETCLFAMDNLARWIAEKKKCAILRCEETGEMKVLDVYEKFLLGRSNKWIAGTFDDRHVSRELAHIYFEDDKCILKTVEYETTSKTFLNDRLLMPSESIELRDGDELRMGSIYHIRFYWMEFTMGE